VTEAPRVSVVIATCNRAALVIQAIESVLGQSYHDFEIVVCDDGSTDDTAAQVARFGPPVGYLALPHTGCPGAARNRGIDAARGEWVAFLDDDDLWEADKLARQIELLDRSPGLDLVYTDRRVRSLDASLSPTIETPAGPGDLLELILNRQMPCICTVLVRRETLRRAGGFDEELDTGEDLDLMLRLAPRARVAGVPQPLVIVRRQPGSVSEQAGIRTFENAIDVLERWRASRAGPAHQRRRARRMLAQLHARLAAAQAEQGDWRGASRAAVRAIVYAPGQVSAWTALPRALAARFQALKR
jgi:glycosyltransferase involved in cell wall biosynthesis